jgi:IS5 family transposase
MLRTVNAQPTLWEAILPEMCLGMPVELEAVDRLLDDPVFFEPFGEHFHKVLGRPSVPIETYLRLTFLKYRYRLGFEPLCREVSDSISWQRFCRIPLGVSVPHPTTLMKITTRCGSSAVDGLNEALLTKAAEAKVLKTNRVRADTTVVPADVCYPTDSGLLARGVSKMAKAVERLKAQGLATRIATRDRTRLVRGHARSIGANLRRRTDEAKDEVKAINAKMARIAGEAAREARRVALDARRMLRRLKQAPPKLAAVVSGLEVTAERVERIAAQTRERLRGVVPDGATRLVSLHDPDARPIRKGRIGKPVEFGYKAQVVDNEDGVVLNHNVEIGNPPDAPMLAPAIKRVARRTKRPPDAVTADRGYGESTVAHALSELGVKDVALPTKGRPTAKRRAVESTADFQELVRWRTGCEGRISCLKRDFGWNRSQIDGLEGARTWCGHGVFNHNLVKIAALVEAD